MSLASCEILLVSTDVIFVYTNIPHKDGIKASDEICGHLRYRKQLDKRIHEVTEEMS